MKKILYILCPILILITGCFVDNGNYEYKDKDDVAPIIASQLNDQYDVLSLSKLEIDPQIKGNADDYTYVWYIYVTNNANIPYDTIGVERKLDYVVNAPSGNYKLIFRVTDKKTGTSAFQESMLTVSSVFSNGYYILKYENNRSDVDFIDRNKVLHPNLLKQLTGEDMAGRPIKHMYTYNRYCYTEEDPNGNLVSNAWQPAYVVCTDEDVRIFHGDRLTLIKNWDNLFMEAPATKRPQGIWGSSSAGFMLLNDGKIHALQGYLYSNGDFGYAFNTPNLKLSNQMAVASSSYLAFDENEGTFIGFQNANGKIITNTYAASVKPNVTGYDLIWSGTQPWTIQASGYTYSIIQNREDGSKILVENYTAYLSMVGFYFTAHYNIPSNFEINQAKVYAVKGNKAANTVIYYSKGDNKVSYYNPNNETEKLSILSIGENEKIVQLKHIYFDGLGTYGDNLNFLAVLAQTASGWKVYSHHLEGSTPDVIPTPFEIFEGSGEPGYLMYRSPNFRMTY